MRRADHASSVSSFGLIFGGRLDSENALEGLYSNMIRNVSDRDRYDCRFRMRSISLRCSVSKFGTVGVGNVVTVFAHFCDSEMYSIGVDVECAHLSDRYCKAGTRNIDGHTCIRRYQFVRRNKDVAEIIRYGSSVIRPRGICELQAILQQLVILGGRRYDEITEVWAGTPLMRWKPFAVKLDHDSRVFNACQSALPPAMAVSMEPHPFVYFQWLD